MALVAADQNVSARILILAWLTLLPALLRGREISQFQLGGGAVVVLTQEVRGEYELVGLVVRRPGMSDVKAWEELRLKPPHPPLMLPQCIVSAALTDNKLGVWLSAGDFGFELVMANLSSGASRLHRIVAPDYRDLQTMFGGQRKIRLTAPGRFEATDYMDRPDIKPIVMECDWDGNVSIDGVPYKPSGEWLVPTRWIKEEEKRRKEIAEESRKSRTKAPEEEARARPR